MSAHTYVNAFQKYAGKECVVKWERKIQTAKRERTKKLRNNTATPAAEIGFIYCRLSNSRDESCLGYSKIYTESAKQSKFASIFVCLNTEK